MASLIALGFLRGAGSLVQGFGSLQQGKAARVAGERQKIAAEFTAWQNEEQAKLAIAIGQRQAAEEKRQADVAASRALAVAASSGGGVSDPTIVNILARTKGEGAYRAAVALYEGEAKARDIRLNAQASRLAGADALVEGLRTQTGHALSAFGSSLQGGASLFAKYGGGGPSGDSGLIGREGG